MRALAWAMGRANAASLVGVVVAVLCASAIVGGLGVLVESGLRSGIAPQRYDGATFVAAQPQNVPVAGDIAVPFLDRVSVPAADVERIAALAGVDVSVGDVSVAIAVEPGRSESGGIAASAHGWGSADLAGESLLRGTAPSAPDEVVVDAALADATGIVVGGDVALGIASVVTTYRLVGVTAPPAGGAYRSGPAVYVTDAQVRAMSGRPDRVDVIEVVASPGVDLDELRATVTNQTGLITAVGQKRGEVEFIDIAGARTTLAILASSFAGVVLIVAMFVVASTLGLSVQRRRREFSLLRAIAVTPLQIHALVGRQVLYLSAVAAVIGAIPGFAVALLLKWVFVRGGVIPGDFALVYSPIPALATIALLAATAQVGAWVAVRKIARVKPVEALRNAEVETPGLSRGRLAGGWAMLVAGLAASAMPLFIGGDIALAGAAGSAMLLMVAVSMLGPRLVSLATGRMSRPLNRVAPVAGYLAGLNTHANSRRLTAAITPLALTIALASVQLFTQTTLTAAAGRQADDGVIADLAVTSPTGLDQQIADAVSDVDGVAAVTPLTRSQVLVEYREFGDPAVAATTAQGVDASTLAGTLDLDVRTGSMNDLVGEAVAIDRRSAATFGVGVGDALEVRLADGTAIEPKVVAIYGRGLGFGDVTFPHDLLIDHVANRADWSILVNIDDPNQIDVVADRLTAALGDFAGVAVLRADQLAATSRAEQQAQAWTNYAVIAILVTYLAISIVNTLVMATTERTRELALLRLIGADRRQVRRMMRTESAIVVAIATVIGTFVALPPLIGSSLALTESPFPAVPITTFIAIIGLTSAIGILAISLPTRMITRQRPLAALNTIS